MLHSLHHDVSLWCFRGNFLPHIHRFLIIPIASDYYSSSGSVFRCTTLFPYLIWKLVIIFIQLLLRFSNTHFEPSKSNIWMQKIENIVSIVTSAYNNLRSPPCIEPLVSHCKELIPGNHQSFFVLHENIKSILLWFVMDDFSSLSRSIHCSTQKRSLRISF